MRYLSILIHNSIPLVGTIFFGWSAVMLLAMFWCDNLFQAVYNSILIILHRRPTNDPDHRTGRPDYSGRRFQWIGDPVSKGTFLSQYTRRIFPVIVFCGAVLFVSFAVFLKLGIDLNFDWRELSIGIALNAAIGLSELLVDLSSIGRRSFLWLQWRVWSSTESGLLVVILLIGMPMVIWLGKIMPALIVLVLVKILADCGALIVDDQKARLWPAGWADRSDEP